MNTYHDSHEIAAQLGAMLRAEREFGPRPQRNKPASLAQPLKDLVNRLLGRKKTAVDESQD
jgi:hypothetical protein